MEIEYYPPNPEISRIKKFGIATLDQWLKHTWILWFFSVVYVICFLLAVRYLSGLWQQHSLAPVLKRVGLACAIPLSFICAASFSFFGLDGRIWLLIIPIAAVAYIWETRYRQN